ncbi:nitrite/sulfite reductase, partial [Streptomyces sp. SID7982]|nr:nitrite/sulfite reductase [Streptomyces sp. SID7982]
MAATPEQPATATPRRKAGRHRGEGQWAVGHHTPLNGNEQFKKDDDGLNVRTRIETIYSKRGFDSIDPNDLRGRMRWWGLYT